MGSALRRRVIAGSDGDTRLLFVLGVTENGLGEGARIPATDGRLAGV